MESVKTHVAALDFTTQWIRPWFIIFLEKVGNKRVTAVCDLQQNISHWLTTPAFTTTARFPFENEAKLMKYVFLRRAKQANQRESFQ